MHTNNALIALFLSASGLIIGSNANEEALQRRHAQQHKVNEKRAAAKCTTGVVLSALQNPIFGTPAASLCSSILHIPIITSTITDTPTTTKVATTTLTSTVVATSSKKGSRRDIEMEERAVNAPIFPYFSPANSILSDLSSACSCMTIPTSTIVTTTTAKTAKTVTSTSTIVVFRTTTASSSGVAVEKASVPTPSSCLRANINNPPVYQDNNLRPEYIGAGLSNLYPGNGTHVDTDISCCALCSSVPNCYAYMFQNYDFWFQTSQTPSTCQLYVSSDSSVCATQGQIDVGQCENTSGAPSGSVQVVGLGPCALGPMIGHADSDCPNTS